MCSVPHRVLCDFHAQIASLAVLLSAPFSARDLSTLLGCTSSEATESPNSCVCTASSSGESFAHNMWNHLLELIFHVQISSDFETLC